MRSGVRKRQLYSFLFFWLIIVVNRLENNAISAFLEVTALAREDMVSGRFAFRNSVAYAPGSS